MVSRSPYVGRILELSEGGRVTACLYPDTNTLLLLGDTEGVRRLLYGIGYDQTATPKYEQSATIRLNRFQVGVVHRTIRGFNNG